MNSLCLVLTIFPMMITLIIMIHNAIPFFEYSNLIKTNCEITEVIYPTRIPLNSTDLQGFVDCDCGRRCTTSLGTCISVYGKQLYSNISMLMLMGVEEQYDTCTIQEISCPDGEDLIDRMVAVDNAKITAQTYINMMNRTIDCYTNKSNNKLFLDHYYDTLPFYISGGFFLFFISIIIFNICYCIWESNNNTNDIHLNQIEG